MLNVIGMPGAGFAMSQTVTFVPAPWWKPLNSGTFAYTFTVGAGEVTPPPGSTWNQTTFSLGSGNNALSLGPTAGTLGMSATITAGTLTLNGPVAGYAVGSTVTLTSSDDPTSIMDRIYKAWDNTVPPPVLIGSGLVADLGPLQVPGVTTPTMLAGTMTAGSTAIAGTGATAGTYVWAWQNDNLNATGDCILGVALVNADGTFSIPLSQALIAGDPASIGVSATETDTSYSGQIVYELTVVPEPSSFMLLGVGSLGLLACTWRRRKAKA